MKGYELSLDDFTYLVRVSSRYHAKQIASWVGFTAHTRQGSVYFRDKNGDEVPLGNVHHALQADDQLQRSVYNLWMSYAR
jgi:hypothetical protein